jgi:hypothetical protein
MPSSAPKPSCRRAARVLYIEANSLESAVRKIEKSESRLCFHACMDSWPGRLATRGISPQHSDPARLIAVRAPPMPRLSRG